MRQLRAVHDTTAERAVSPIGGLHVQHGTSPAPSTHILQVYEDEEFFARTVAEFIGGGLTTGRPAVVIATPAHRDAIVDALKEWDRAPARFVASGQLRWLDARDTLALLMDGREPRREPFVQVVGGVIEQSARQFGDGPVYAHGEMVDLLWREGNCDGASRLEVLWNELAERLHVHLLCTYPMAGFADAAHAGSFDEICAHHSQVLPTERFNRFNDEAALREVVMLQQRALALETELRVRQQLEGELRAALVERDELLAREQRSRQEAEAANRAKSDFLAVMSHELRTPLNAIGGYVDLLELGVRGSITEAQREDLGRIQRSQRHLLGLINEVLNYTRIETGAIRYALADVHLGDVVASVEPLIRPQLDAEGLRLTVDADADSDSDADALVARADAEKVRQVLLNLLSNAVKFTPRGGLITIHCKAATDASDRRLLQLQVSDTGEGIPAEKLEAVFEPFVQVHTGLTRPHEGTGLGLAISRDLARGMGGELSVRSTVGKGSVFTLALPPA